MTKQSPTTLDLPKQAPGESDRDYERRLMAFIRGDDIRTVTDLRGYKSADFSLSVEPTQRKTKQTP
jgi:hypothetical protein